MAAVIRTTGEGGRERRGGVGGLGLRMRCTNLSPPFLLGSFSTFANSPLLKAPTLVSRSGEVTVVPSSSSQPWTLLEDQRLYKLIEEGEQDWAVISKVKLGARIEATNPYERCAFTRLVVSLRS